MPVKCGTLTVGKKVENGFNVSFEVLQEQTLSQSFREEGKHDSKNEGILSRQLSSVIPAPVLRSTTKDECPESMRGMIPDVAGMTIQTPRHC